MCGICGFIDQRSSDGSQSRIELMLDAIAHRGPDAKGVWLDRKSRVALANSRLSVIGLDAGEQPAVSECGRYTLVFNGEIYNFKILKKELIQLGIQTETSSDTDILLLSLIVWGEKALEKLRGMFAFAFYDQEEQSLMLVRDRVGVKPLYYYIDSSSIFFASEIKSILASDRVVRKINHSALIDTLSLGYPLLPMSAFKDIFELEPGTVLKYRMGGKVEKKKYFSWTEYVRSKVAKDVSSIVKTLQDSVEEQLIADVPIGSFLSGGIDSSLIASIIRKDLGKELSTYTVSFGDEQYNEAPIAANIARLLGTQHTELSLKENVRDLQYLQDIILHFDQPFADSSAIPTYEISKQIRSHVKVALSGDGGDEMFGGYPFFSWMDLIKKVGSTPIKNLAKTILPILRFHPNLQRKAFRFLAAAESTGSRRAVELLSYVSPREISEVTYGELRNCSDSYESQFQAISSDSNIGGVELIDAIVVQMLPGDFLRKVDMMSSAHGLEVRVPYLHEPMLELGATLPKKQLYDLWTNKKILREITRRYLPDNIVNRPKTGFGIPLDQYLGQSGRDEVTNKLLSPNAKIHSFIAKDYSREIANSFRDLKWNQSKFSRFMLYQRLYTLWSLELWLEKWNPQ